ncbi:hypothetical protein MNBD_GAMMA07-2540 [hydrothermal vent metagenome]|uniref:Uncharacterized protein n=1 Tax=hydrothermal vent metagenome TaxID=652676 RepID=A0A3B0WPC4_9ZZZZ
MIKSATNLSIFIIFEHKKYCLKSGLGEWLSKQPCNIGSEALCPVY